MSRPFALWASTTVLRRAALVAVLCIARATTALSLDPTTSLSEYARASWTVRDGLPSNLVWAIAQDASGYLWLGTDGGLVRFDGVRFVSWSDLGAPTLPATTVRVLLKSKNGDLWIGFGEAGGVARWRNGTLTTYSGDDGVPDRTVTFFEDREGAIWAGGVGGLSRFLDEKWDRIPEWSGINSDALSSLYEDRQGAMWVVTVREVFVRRAGDTRFVHVPTPFRVSAVAEDGSGALWFASSNAGIGRLGGPGQQRTKTPLQTLNAWRLLHDSRGNFWIATLGQGLWRISTDQEEPPSRVERLVGASFLTSDAVRSLFEDREGNLWVGTQNGLNRFSERSPVQMSSERDVSRSVRAVTATSDGRVWAATEDGLYRFTAGIAGAFVHYDQRHGLPNAVVHALHAATDGRLWATTFGGGVVRFTGDHFERALPEGVPRGSIWAFTRDAQGALWLCESFKNLSLWSNETLHTLNSFPGSSQLNICSAAFTDSRGRVWIGFADGRVSVRENGAFRSYSSEDGLTGGSVSAIAEDDDGAIWIGSKDGLSRFDADGRFSSILGEDRLPIDNVRGIAFDRRGDIWLGVSAGIVRLGQKELHRAQPASAEPIDYTLYDAADGLRGLPMSPRGYPTATRSADGSLWFVTSDGLAVVDPERLNAPLAPPPVIIEEVHADGRRLAPVPELALAPLTSSIQIDYTALTLSNPTKTRFRYKLEGFDAEWVDAGTRRQAYYTNLPPRSYRFRVVAGTGGAWGGTGATWTFAVEPTFYQTLWFYAALVLTAALAVLMAWRVRTERVRRQFALILGERNRVARDIHDTLLQSLVGLGFQFDALESDLDTVEEARKRITRMRVQVGMHVRDFRQSIWDLRSGSTDTSGLSHALHDMACAIQEDGVTCDAVVHGTERSLTPRVNEALRRVAQEATSNAVRHGRPTQIAIQLAYRTDSVRLTVVDNGRGFDPETQQPRHITHWGLAIMKERARQIGGTCRIDSAEGTGTTVEMDVPLSATTSL